MILLRKTNEICVCDSSEKDSSDVRVCQNESLFPALIEKAAEGETRSRTGVNLYYVSYVDYGLTSCRRS